MNAQRSSYHSLRLILAIIMIGFSFTAGTPQAQAKCCTIYIDNQSVCEFKICIKTPTGTKCVVVAQGINKWDICDDFTVYTVSDCNNTFEFPAVGCIEVKTNGCCFKICNAGTCTWKVTNGDFCRC